MANIIDTVFFDVGATLRYVVEDPEFAAAAEKELMELVGAREDHDTFFEKFRRWNCGCSICSRITRRRRWRQMPPVLPVFGETTTDAAWYTTARWKH